MNKLSPTSTNFRNILYHQYQKMDASFCHSNNHSIAVKEFSSQDNGSQLEKLALIDLTAYQRIGYKGKDTPKWLEKQKIELPIEPNTSIKHSDGSIIAKLSSNEYLLLSNPNNEKGISHRLENAWIYEDYLLCYQLLRQHSHCWFLMTGQYATETLAKLCGVDLRENYFALNQVAQTSLARLNSIIIRDEINSIPTYHILSDSASIEYLRDCLLDAMQEFNGVQLENKNI